MKKLDSALRPLHLALRTSHIGILALQGNFAEHADVLDGIGVQHSFVRSITDLSSCSHLIIPGGESTTIRTQLAVTGLDTEIVRRVRDGSLSVFGFCAGAILLATEITGKNAPKPLGLLAMTIDRNAYGTQMQSFAAEITVTGIDHPVKVSFIRAPVITQIGEGTEVLAQHTTHPVVIRSGSVWASTCHPEMHRSSGLHSLFLA